MKIVFLTSDMNPKAGWGRFGSDLINGLKKSGHDVIILKEQDDGYKGTPVLRGGLGIFISALRVRKYLRDCDVIHAFDGYPYGVIAALAGVGMNKKIIISCIGTYSVAPLYNKKIALFLKWAYRKSDKLLAISKFTKDEIIKKVSLDNIEVLELGVDYNKFYQKHDVVEEDFIISVGGLKSRKGYHIAIPAFAMAKKNNPNLKYKIVGDQGDVRYFNLLKELVKKYNIEDSVEFLSGISDEQLTELYKQAKIFVLPSVNMDHNFEGFGLVFLEAAAAGLPVIGTLGNGIEDSVKNGFNGILVEQENIEGTAQAINTMMGDKKRWEQMSQNSYKWAKDHDWPIIIDKYINLYNQL